MLGSVLKLAGAVFLPDSLAVSHVPCTVVFVKITVLIAEICFHANPPSRRPQPHRSHLLAARGDSQLTWRLFGRSAERMTSHGKTQVLFLPI